MFGLALAVWGCSTELWPSELTPADQVTVPRSRPCTCRTRANHTTISMSVIIKKVMKAPGQNDMSFKICGRLMLEQMHIWHCWETLSPSLGKKWQPLKQPSVRERIEELAASFHRTVLFNNRHFWPCWGRLKFPFQKEGQASSQLSLDIMQ